MGTAMMTIICRILKYCLQGITTTLHDFACLCLLLSDNIVQCWIFNNMYLLPVSRPALIQRTSIIMIIILPSTFILLGKKNLPMFFSPAVQCSQGNVPRSHMNLLRGKRKKKVSLVQYIRSLKIVIYVIRRTKKKDVLYH